jgi:hypothetical protein
MILCIRRQARLSRADYQVFASDLEGFDLPVIERALERLGKTPCAEGKAAFPDSGTLIQACRDAQPQPDTLGEIRARNAKAEAEAAAEKAAAEAKAKEDED